MRENHEKQPELTGIHPAAPTESAQVVEMSEVAALQAKVIELGLVRESRPVFVYDDKLAKEKSATTTRQAKYREKMNALGFAKVDVPRELVEKVRTAHGGDWSAFIKSTETKQPDIASPEVVKEISEAGNIETWLKKKVDSAISELPKPSIPQPKVMENPVLKLTAEEKKTLKIGQKVVSLTGWRAKFVRFLLDM